MRLGSVTFGPDTHHIDLGWISDALARECIVECGADPREVVRSAVSDRLSRLPVAQLWWLVRRAAGEPVTLDAVYTGLTTGDVARFEWTGPPTSGTAGSKIEAPGPVEQPQAGGGVRRGWPWLRDRLTGSLPVLMREFGVSLADIDAMRPVEAEALINEANRMAAQQSRR